ncbi:metallophosphoesterase [Bacteroides sp.]|uniref:metallophosphoesterase n=1 Tax=Bacteroides sp. TaxID=29523 RepID=UPI002FC60479
MKRFFLHSKTLLTTFILLSLTLQTVTVMAYGEQDKHSSKEECSTDGPYLIHLPGGSLRMITVNPLKQIVDTTLATIPHSFSFPVLSNKGTTLFEVSLHSLKKQSPQMKQAEKVLVVSDPHGNFDCFADLLQANGVINKQYKWTFGSNQLVVIGDVFDRGKDVLPIFWLIYKLEKEAHDAGGTVVFLLGNHEVMVLQGDTRYMKEKYTTLARQLHLSYKTLFDESSELGRWLSMCNTIQLIGKNLFVHAGLSSDLYKRKLSVAQINSTISNTIFLPKEDKKSISPLTDFLYGGNGPIWYRGMVKSDDKYKPLSTGMLSLLLNQYGADRIIVGHTIFPDITTFNDGRIIAINVDNKENREKKLGRGILIENNKISVIGDSGMLKKQLPL